jgi:hypothetical protein
MKTDLLFPLALQAYMLSAVDGESVPIVIQSFVKSRGGQAAVYRMLHSSSRDEGRDGEPRTQGWSITNKESFASYANTSKEEDSVDFTSMAELVEYLKRHPRMSTHVRETAMSHASDATYLHARTNLCSDAEGGVVTPESCGHVVVRKVNMSAFNELDSYLDSLVKWIQVRTYYNCCAVPDLRLIVVHTQGRHLPQGVFTGGSHEPHMRLHSR